MTSKNQEIGESAQRYVDAVAEAETAGDEQFFFWFDVSSSLEEDFAGGERTFRGEILTPSVRNALGSIGNSSALEIGHGGANPDSCLLKFPARHGN